MARPSLITIDGPAAAGKTSLGRLLARELGYVFVDTGAMYRALTRLALDGSVSIEDQQALADLARRSPFESLATDVGSWAAGTRDVDSPDDSLTDPAVEAAVPLVSRAPGVRLAMVEKQRRLAEKGGVVMAGRDIGTIVLPHAEMKLFLMASVAERARRRYLETKSRNGAIDCEKVLADLQARDRIDRERKYSPLTPAPGSTIINTDKLTMAQVLDKVLWLIDSC